ncbi:MAG TPA: HAMP domain-containing sensor histidine kinase, partial [Geobacteraceae bacterium]|nr:HAMP domain-containing sensor histidine kinase [Geobacteraceae bacterium]
YLTDESLFEATERILGLVDHMAQTIKVFRDFYRPVKERTIFSLNDAIDKALLFTEAALRFETVDVHVRVDSGLLVTGYQNEFSQVLMNILNNATEAFKERKTKEPTVLIEAFGENGKAVVSITDNAGGIPEALVGRIFDIYFTTRECKGGSGIGLYLSKTIIEKNMGGTLRVENTEYGARFRIELDLVEYPDAAFSQNQALEQSVPA